jgi:excisionase family DNA binding protein
MVRLQTCPARSDDTLSLPACPTLTVREAAALLRVNVKTLYAEIALGHFPAIRLGRVLRISRNVVASCLEQGRVAPTGGINGGKAR